jgi:hypothetical protein
MKKNRDEKSHDTVPLISWNKRETSSITLIKLIISSRRGKVRQFICLAGLGEIFAAEEYITPIFLIVIFKKM